MADDNRKEVAKAKIQAIISDFERGRDEYNKTDEANIETKLIEPLFEALGWSKGDFEKREKVKRKDKRGVTDYTFRIQGKSVFVLEAKKVKVDIEADKNTWKQTISYTFSKKVSFAILTNFEKLLIFCVEDEKALRPFRELKYTEYLSSRFDDLWLISRESFEQNLIFDRAASEGRMKKRRSIDDELLEDMILSRKSIAESIEHNYPGKYSTIEKDDIAQRIFGRLVFVRKCEDKQINFDKDGKEIELLKEVTALPHDEAYSKLKKIFSKYDESYDSELFAKDLDSDVDKIDIDGKVLKELISHTYTSGDGNYIYNFEWIDADILGNIYEQYLGRILKETAKQTRLKESHAHRKEQGIYYTPTEVVKYIVDNTLGEMLREKKPGDVRKLRVLDPACGSGSFLLKAFDVLENHYEKTLNKQYNKFDSSGEFFTIKEQVLVNNIFGVDLDRKAVEIAQLNLLLKVAEKGHRLPLLQKNIQNGNSLIDDEAVAGDKAFKWEERFAEIMKDGGFDVVIGNPPYGADLSDADLSYLSKLKTSKIRNYDTYVFFIENCLNVLKEGGLFGFIIPDTFLRKSDLITLREIILNNFKVKIIAEVGAVFGDAKVTENVIFIFQKCSNEKERQNNQLVHCSLNKNLPREKRLELISGDVWESKGKISQKNWAKAPEMRLGRFNRPEMLAIVDKIEKGISLGEMKNIDISRGSEGGKKQISKTKTSNDYKPIVIPDDVWRYGLKFSEKYFPIQDASNEKYSKEKLLIIRIRNTRLKERIIAAYDETGIYTLKTLQMIYPVEKGEVNLKYLLGVINSKLINFYCQHYLSDDINKKYLQGLKIVVSEKHQNELTAIVDRMISLNKKLAEFGDKNTPETARLKEEIQKTDAQIDELVYDLYGLTERKERKIVEEAVR